ncbi:hypothetical protein SUGI_0793100 [Cryptomeria japonica]|nr:hypothetical protein SUGI_0793100 [Cryptomeria japonica]
MEQEDCQIALPDILVEERANVDPAKYLSAFMPSFQEVRKESQKDEFDIKGHVASENEDLSAFMPSFQEVHKESQKDEFDIKGHVASENEDLSAFMPSFQEVRKESQKDEFDIKGHVASENDDEANFESAFACEEEYMSLHDSAEIEDMLIWSFAKSTTNEGMNVFDDSLIEYRPVLTTMQEFGQGNDVADFENYVNEDDSEMWLCEWPNPLAEFDRRPSALQILKNQLLVPDENDVQIFILC